MSTSNKTSEKTESSRRKRTSKSIDPKAGNFISPQKDLQVPSTYYQCRECRNILANSNSILNTMNMEELLLFFSTKTDTFSLNGGEVFLAAESEYDQFCAYNTVTCAFCGETLGRYYLSTTEKMNEAKSVFVIPESSFLMFDTKTEKISTPSGQKKKVTRRTTSSKKELSNVKTSERKSENKTNSSIKEGSNRSTSIVSSAQSTPNNQFESEEKKLDEIKKVDETKKQLLGVMESQEVNPIQEVGTSFQEMKGILNNFLMLLDQFEKRISTTEKTVTEIHKTLTGIYGALNITELIDLSE